MAGIAERETVPATSTNAIETPAGGTSAPDPRGVELVLAQLDGLPALSPVVDRLLAMTADERSSAAQVIRLIESDPSLTARLLSLLARAEHGVRPEGVTLSNAVTLLGFEAVRHAALVTKVMEVFGPQQGPREGEFDRFEFWKHCLAVACASRRIAEALRGLGGDARRGAGVRVAPEEAFICGLLHDLGKVAIDAGLPKSFARVVRRANETRGDISDAERAILGLDHTVAGRRLAERWRLPRRLVETIWLHHQEPAALPASVAAGGHVQIVQLADAMARELRIGYSGNYRHLYESTDLARQLGLPEDARRAIVDALAEDVAARAEWIGSKELRSTEVYLHALTQATEDLSTANRALAAANRRLARKAEYLDALGLLNKSLSPRAAVRDACQAGAEAVRRGTGAAAAVVIVLDASGGWAEAGCCNGSSRGEIIELSRGADESRAAGEAAAQSAAAGAWVAPPDRAFDGWVARYQGVLRGGPVWLLPIVREGRWVAGALLAADGPVAANWREESAELESLSEAVGLAITQAQAQSAAMAMGDELARINRERAVRHAEQVRTRSLETIVSMAAGAAHELNNPLAVISGRAQLLASRLSDETARDVLAGIAGAAKSASEIVSDLLEFARPRPPAAEPVDVRALAESIRSEMQSGHPPAACELSVDIASDTGHALFDREQLAATLRELVRNALDHAGPSLRSVRIKAWCDSADKSLVIQVRDDGSGMTPDVLERAMDPFFSHRPAGRRRGMGLSRARQWVVQNGGDIRLRSRPGAGTEVELRLRRASA